MPLVVPWDKVLKDGHVSDELLSEDTEIIGPRLRGRHHEYLGIGVSPQPPDNVGAGDPALAHATEPHDHSPLFGDLALKEVSNFVLDRSSGDA